MKPSRLLLLSLTLLLALPAAPQQARSNVAASALTAVPPLIPYSGVVNTVTGVQPAADASITFLIYKDEQGGEPLFAETQALALDATGHYKAQLGATLTNGIPIDLFATGEARWLEVQAAGEAPQPRVLLVSVPYALKAADAATLGGLPPSAFLTAAGSPAGPVAPQFSGVPLPAQTVIAPAASTTGSGTTNFIPLWTSSTNLGNSMLSQSSGNLQVNAGLQLPQVGTATASAAFNSRPIDLFASSFNSSAQTPIVQHFRWQAEPVGSNTSAASGRVGLLYAPGVGTLAETGLSISSKGILTFAPGQTLPATTVTGNETVKGTVSATQLISSVTQGTAPLKVTSTTQVSNLNASLLGGLSSSAFALRGAPNTFLGTQTVSGNLKVTGSINGALLVQGSVTDPGPGLTSANVIAGFTGNRVTNGFTGATIGGGGLEGQSNIVNFDFGTVGGGAGNTAGSFSTVGGGQGNTATDYSTVAGGAFNNASGSYSTVAGGVNSIASGYSSFAAGNNADATADGSFVWCQYDGSACDSGTAANTFLVAVDGPIYMFDGFNGQGCYLNPGTSGWQCSSDRNLKDNIRRIESRSVLEGVAHMPISQWSMKADTAGYNHIGPMAQDFYAAFGLGDSDKYIAQGDAQGVALASIQGLYQLVQEKDEQIRNIVHEKDEQIRLLQTALELLETRVARSESALGLHH